MTAFDDWRARSPFYDETHEALAQSVRRFVAREIAPHIDRWEAEGELPRDLHIKASDAGILGLRYPEEYGGHSEGFDNFHSLVRSEEPTSELQSLIRTSYSVFCLTKKK